MLRLVVSFLLDECEHNTLKASSNETKRKPTGHLIDTRLTGNEIEGIGARRRKTDQMLDAAAR
jgi:hypothetical protein